MDESTCTLQLRISYAYMHTAFQVNSTPYADFKPGIASSYVMEQVFGKLHVTTQAEIDDVIAQRRASLIDIPEGETATVVNYFR